MKIRSLAWRFAPLIVVFSCRDDITAPARRTLDPHNPAMAEAVAGISPAVSAGGYHTCALKNDASIVCWGYNPSGQSTPPTDLGPVSQVSAGTFHTCALKTDGTVRCWGYNGFGQATVPSGLASVAEVSAALSHTCALRRDGTVLCWGLADLQLEVPAGLNEVSQISAGVDHTCALRTDNTVVCWGYNEYGQSSVPSDLTGVTQVSVGDRSTCALSADGTVRCWGYNVLGQTNVPSGLTSVSHIGVGYLHVCVARTDGTVACWGNSQSDQATVPAGLTSVSKVSGGLYHTCALEMDGTVQCWGENSRGQSAVPAGLDLTSDLPQTITFISAPPSPAVVGATYMVAANGGGSGNPVTFSVVATDGACTLSDNTVTLHAVGSCTIAADQSASPGFLAASQATQTFEVVDGQQLDFTSTPPGPAVVGMTYALSAQGGGSGSPITFSSLSATVCTVEGSTAMLIHAGTCFVAADQAGGNGYLAAPQATQSFSVADPQGQAINFTSIPPHPAVVGRSYTVTATGGGSANPVLFSSLTRTVCFVIGNTVSFVERGTCRVAADQTGNAYYLPAPQVTQTFDIYELQAITFTSVPPAPGVVGETYSVAATGGLSGNPVTFTSLDTGVCALSGATVYLRSAGTCIIAADQAEGSGYLAAPTRTQSFTVVAPIPQAVNITSSPPNPAIVGGTYTVAALGGGSGNPVLFSSLTPSACFVIGNTVSFLTRATCRIAGDQAGNTYYLPAAQATQTFDIYETQSIALTSTPPVPAIVGGTYSITATGSLSGNSVTFSSLSNDVCNVSGSTASLIRAGTCVIAADQAEGSGYLAAPRETQSFTVVAPIAQTITFISNPPSPAIFGGSYHVAAAGGGSGNQIVITSLTRTTCTVVGNSVSFDAAGPCTIAANQSGTALYLDAEEKTQSFTINPAPQFITFTTTPPSGAVVPETYHVAATGGASGNQVTFSSLTPAVCQLTGPLVFLLSEGTCTVAADQARTADYLAAPQVTQSFGVVEPRPQTISFTSTPPNPAVVGGTYIVSAVGGASGNPVLFSSLTPSVCFVVGNTVSLVTRGTCRVAADQADSRYYLNAVQATQTFDIFDVQAITFISAPPAPAIVGMTYSITATGGLSGNPVTFSSLSTSVCTLSGSNATLTGAGTCIIAADQAEGGGYLAAPRRTQSFTVAEPMTQTIAFTSTPPNPPIIGGTYVVSASGGASGNPVTFSSLTPGTCGITGATAGFNTRGTCTIAANQAGNARYLPASQVTQTFVIDTRPVANAGSAQTGYEGSPVSFNAAGSSDADGDAITTYTWDFGDGTVQSVSSPTVQHTYNDNSATAYVVTLTVRDARGASSLPATTSALIGNIAPIGWFSPPTPVGEGVMNLSLTGVQDALGDLSTLQYAFDCGDGSGFRAYGAASSFACNAADNGSRSVRVRVKDKDGAISEYSGSVSVINVAPTIVIVSAPATGTVGVDYTIRYRFTDPGTTDSPWWYQTNWGDGKKVGVNAATTQGATITQTYRYASPGTYTIAIKVSDKDAGTATSVLQVTISR